EILGARDATKANRSDANIVIEHPEREGGLYRVVNETTGETLAQTPDYEIATREANRAHVKPMKVHVMDITPQLRKVAMEQGFPQFARGGGVKLTPVAHDPFESHAAIRRAVHASRSPTAGSSFSR